MRPDSAAQPVVRVLYIERAYLADNVVNILKTLATGWTENRHKIEG